MAQVSQLALRKWTVERYQGLPALWVLGDTVSDRPTEERFWRVYAITDIKVVGPTEFRIIIKDGRVFTTRNVEEWPALDRGVFEHFMPPSKVDAFLPDTPPFVPLQQQVHEARQGGTNVPNKHEPDPALLQGAYSRDRLPLAGTNVEHYPVGKNSPKLMMFDKRLVGREKLLRWINDHELAENVVSIHHEPGLGYLVHYRAYEEVAD